MSVTVHESYEGSEVWFYHVHILSVVVKSVESYESKCEAHYEGRCFLMLMSAVQHGWA